MWSDLGATVVVDDIGTSTVAALAAVDVDDSVLNARRLGKCRPVDSC